MKNFLNGAVELMADAAIGFLKMIWTTIRLCLYAITIALIILPFIKPGDDFYSVFMSNVDPLSYSRYEVKYDLFVRQIQSAWVNGFLIAAVMQASKEGFYDYFSSKVKDFGFSVLFIERDVKAIKERLESIEKIDRQGGA